MKRGLSIAIIILVTFGLSSLALAAKKSPPKQVCWELTGGAGSLNGALLMLGIKSGVKIKTGDGNVKFYIVEGLFIPGFISPVHGTGYMTQKIDPDYVFAGSLTSDSPDTNIYNFELFFDVNSLVGHVYIDLGDSTGEDYYILSEVDCRAYDIVTD